MKSALMGVLVFSICLFLSGISTTTETVTKNGGLSKPKHEHTGIYYNEDVSKDQKRIELKGMMK